MARAKSPEKRSAILQAAVHEIAEAGLAASTANIARRAGVAEGTPFVYFASKEELLNELYLELKIEVYSRVNARFPHKASLEKRARHVWSSFLGWATEFPEKRKASVQLNVSDLITPETRARTLQERGVIDAVFSELDRHDALRGLPAGSAAAVLSALQEATMDLIAKHPKRRNMLIERGFELFWRAVR